MTRLYLLSHRPPNVFAASEWVWNVLFRPFRRTNLVDPYFPGVTFASKRSHFRLILSFAPSSFISTVVYRRREHLQENQGRSCNRAGVYRNQ